MKVKFKKISDNATLPSYSKEGDGALDLTCTEIVYENNYTECKLGVAVEIPKGYVGLIFPRSSITNKNLILKNSVGIIDSNYRGELSARFYELIKYSGDYYKIGDRCCQLVILPYPSIEPYFVEELTETNRNADGFGSSGN